MASSLLPFPFPPTATSYRAGAIFKFEMCQSALRHPVYIHQFLSVICHLSLILNRIILNVEGQGIAAMNFEGCGKSNVVTVNSTGLLLL